MTSPRMTALVTVIFVLMMGASGVMAQDPYDPHGEYDQHPGEETPTQDTTVLPLIIPEMGDYAAAPSEDGEEGEDASGGVGGSAYIDYSSYYKSGSLAPAYTFSPAFKSRLRIPLIFNRTIEFGDGDATTSGIGDIALDMEYKKKMGGKGQMLRFTGTVKFPTGDNEAEDNGHIVALGTGSMDFLGRLQYSRSTKKTGFIGTALYRMNSSGEAISGDNFWTTTTETTNGNLFVLSGFGRYHAQGAWWLHFGLSVAFTGDGESKVSNVSSTDSSWDWENESDILSKSTFIDIFPGVSYDLGIISPYLGVRIPLSSSYDAENSAFPYPDRETSVVLQFSYNPKSMTRD